MRRVLESYFSRARQARLILAFVMILTGATGFGFSLLFLRCGIGSMGVRYPLAVIGAWLVFLLLIRAWVALESRRFDPDSPDIREAMANPASDPAPRMRESTSEGSWLDWLDASYIEWPEFDSPGCLLAAGGVIVVGLGALLLSILGAMPALVAEIFVDVALSSLLYRRLKHAAIEHWLGTCIRRTWLFVLAAMALLGAGGWLLDYAAPNSNTIGKAIQEAYESYSSKQDARRKR